MQPFPRKRLQRIRHVDQRAFSLGLDKAPLFALGMFELDTPIGAKDQRKSAAVGMGVVATLGECWFRGVVEQLEACFVGDGGAIAVVGFEAVAIRQR